MERAAPWSPIWPCTRWGLPCLLACARSGGLLLHLFTLTPLIPGLSILEPLFQPWKERGGIFSVALSVRTPRGVASRVYPLSPPSYVGGYEVTRHRALWCSDFPPLRIAPEKRFSALPKSGLEYANSAGNQDTTLLRSSNVNGGPGRIGTTLRIRPQLSSAVSYSATARSMSRV
jgi:hypothetical protein